MPDSNDDLFHSIVQELYRAVQRWTEDPNLLGIIGSWRDTQDDAQTLHMLHDYNEHPQGEIIHKIQ
jgi:hypothetical protein